MTGHPTKDVSIHHYTPNNEMLFLRESTDLLSQCSNTSLCISQYKINVTEFAQWRTGSLLL